MPSTSTALLLKDLAFIIMLSVLITSELSSVADAVEKPFRSPSEISKCFRSQG
ncbi:hypothetical protein [Microcoleus vaginatus]|uniref:hypothetical protein n=1 Tax=Microcoleus vaginatus TaxID=119532 RepID=UPI001F6216D2